eukprot:Skav213713  [mRNA]  locus=scaffold549:80722:88089:+ [translate_table: standard]
MQRQVRDEDGSAGSNEEVSLKEAEGLLADRHWIMDALLAREAALSKDSQRAVVDTTYCTLPLCFVACAMDAVDTETFVSPVPEGFDLKPTDVDTSDGGDRQPKKRMKKLVARKKKASGPVQLESLQPLQTEPVKALDVEPPQATRGRWVDEVALDERLDLLLLGWGKPCSKQ